jgi:hypothetical protein
MMMHTRVTPVAIAFATLVLVGSAGAQMTTEFSVNLIPTQDAYVRQLAEPGETFGASGAMSVAGLSALNVQGQQQGLAESWIMFDASSAVDGFNAQFGEGGWTLIGATLVIEEVGAPNNPTFARGVGTFEVTWVANDDWSEGSGNTNDPGSGGDNVLTFDSRLTLRNAELDASLGVFMNNGADGDVTLILEVADGLQADVSDRGMLTLNLTPADNAIGFTFHSSDFSSVQSWPALVLTAVEAGADDNGNTNANGNDNGDDDDDNSNSDDDGNGNGNGNGNGDDDNGNDNGNGNGDDDNGNTNDNANGNVNGNGGANGNANGNGNGNDNGNSGGPVVLFPSFGMCGAGMILPGFLSLLLLASARYFSGSRRK